MKSPIHFKLTKTATRIRVSTDGKTWGGPVFNHEATFGDACRIGPFVSSGNTFATTTATFSAVKLVK